ncbi:MAG: hypothetical protein U9N61_04030 [Euryarchaeota archaeon]|nr:hypothetical protein [Euryarchaeota archaeon]
MNNAVEYLQRMGNLQEEYFDYYAQTTPRPAKPKEVSVWREWNVLFPLIVSAAAILLSAMRTADGFMEIAKLSFNGPLASLFTFLAIMGTEMWLAVMLAVRAERQLKQKVEMKEDFSISDLDEGASRNTIFWAIVGLLTVVILIVSARHGFTLLEAGINNADMVSHIKYWLDLLTAFALGPISGIASILSGDILGRQVAHISLMSGIKYTEWENELQQWRKKATSSFNRNKKKFMKDFAVTATQAPVTQSPTRYDNLDSGEGKTRIESWLEKNNISPLQNLSATQIAKETRVRPGTVRAILSRMRSEIKESSNGN